MSGWKITLTLALLIAGLLDPQVLPLLGIIITWNFNANSLSVDTLFDNFAVDRSQVWVKDAGVWVRPTDLQVRGSSVWGPDGAKGMWVRDGTDWYLATPSAQAGFYREVDSNDTQRDHREYAREITGATFGGRTVKGVNVVAAQYKYQHSGTGTPGTMEISWGGIEDDPGGENWTGMTDIVSLPTPSVENVYEWAYANSIKGWKSTPIPLGEFIGLQHNWAVNPSNNDYFIRWDATLYFTLVLE